MFESESDRLVFTQDGETAILTTGAVSVPVKGFPNYCDDTMFQGDVQSRKNTFFLPSDQAAIAIQGSELLLDSVVYTVVLVELKGDGKFTQLILSE